MLPNSTLIILIAPNVSEQMGGEAIKALQIFRELQRTHGNVLQITHGRNRAEVLHRLRLEPVELVDDTATALFLWRTVIFRWLLDYWFSRKAIALAEKIASQRGLCFGEVILHQTEPNSPVMLRALSKKHINCFGPINGNIYYPSCFRRHESLVARMRRLLHFPLQRINRVLPKGLKRANLILVAGGERTRQSLLAAGCRDHVMLESLDCGISDKLLARKRIKHLGRNLRFVHFGRIVFHKGTSLVISSLAKTQTPVCLDVIGRGPELENCRQLSRLLGLEKRVRFLDWFTSHDDLFDSLEEYRGLALPSIEDANGIVVQEAMALGLPVICLDWGGPQLLIEHGVSGYLIAPQDEAHIVERMAEYLDRLCNDGVLAESMSIAAREKACDWRWSKVTANWLDAYSKLIPVGAEREA